MFRCHTWMWFYLFLIQWRFHFFQISWATMQSFHISPINFRNTLGVPWLGITALRTKLQLDSFYMSSPICFTVKRKWRSSSTANHWWKSSNRGGEWSNNNQSNTWEYARCSTGKSVLLQQFYFQSVAFLYIFFLLCLNRDSASDEQTSTFLNPKPL